MGTLDKAGFNIHGNILSVSIKQSLSALFFSLHPQTECLQQQCGFHGRGARTLHRFGDDAGYSAHDSLQKQALLLNCIGLTSGHTNLWTLSLRTFSSPFPPLARLSPKSLGGRFISSRRFCWYSLSIVMAARPLPTDPVILETMPAAPPARGISSLIILIAVVIICPGWH